MDNYIDIHSHVLHQIDDGSKTIEQSLEIIKEYKQMGFSDIVLTPHYIEDSKYTLKNKEKIKKINELKELIENENIDINLHTGNEVYITDNILKLLKKDEISTISNSRYILIELPMHNEIANLKEIIFNLLSHDITPIIAHPERYNVIQKNIDYAKELVNQGALLQMNYGSIIGIYGKQAQKTAKKLLKNNTIDFLGTDVHRPNNKIYININKIRKKIKKIIGEDRFIQLTITNPKKIIENSLI